MENEGSSRRDCQPAISDASHEKTTTEPRQLSLIDLPAEDGELDPLLAQLEPRGETYEPTQDRERLGRQLRSVLDLMTDGEWRTLAQIGDRVAGAQTAISARLRDLRRAGYIVERRRDEQVSGLHWYRLAGGGGQ